MQNLTDYAGMDALDVFFREDAPVDYKSVIEQSVFDNPFVQQ